MLMKKGVVVLTGQSLQAVKSHWLYRIPNQRAALLDKVAIHE